MRKDPTEFRERFQRWKKGEQVYENGLALPAYEDGKDANDVPSYTPSIDDREQPGYRKYLWELSKARRNAFLKEYGYAAPIKNYYEDFLSNSEGTFNYRRWYNLASPAERKYGLEKGLAHWRDADGKTSLHPSFSIESPYSGYKNPYNPKGITGGKWIDDDHYEFSDSQINNDWPINKTLDEFDWSRKEEGSNTYGYYKGGVMLHEPTIIGKMPKYEDGLTPLRKPKVNTNQATYNPEEDLYTGRYTLPEVTITGDKSKRVYRSHAPRTSGVSKNQYRLQTGDLLGAMTTGMNVFSPSQWWGAIRDANGLQDGFNRLMRGNSGFTTEKYAKEHPYMSTGMNLAGDAAALGVLNTIKPKPNFVPTLNSNLEGIRYAYSRNPELANIGTIEEYNDYIKTIFPESKVRDINYHMGPKGLQELKPSTGEVHNTNPGARGIYVTPDKSYSQSLRKYTTDRLEKPSGWIYLKRNLTPRGWDKANEIFTDIYPVMVDTKNPLYTKGTWTWGFKDSKYKSLMDKYDAIVNSGPKWYQNVNSMPETIVPKTEQTLILGSDADVAGFRKFIYNQ